MANWRQGKFQPTNPQKYHGRKVPTYRSGWELQFMRMLDQHPGVLAWSSEAYRIPYINPITGKKTTYVPDFFMVYVDANGKQHAELVEVKPSSQIVGNAKGTHDQAHAVVNEAKWKQAGEWCRQQGIGFRVVTENDMFNKPQKPRPQRPKRRKKR